MSSETALSNLTEQLTAGSRTIENLPAGGFLFVEHDLPFLLVYRNKVNDAGTIRLARSSASYLILADETPEVYQPLLLDISRKMADKHGAFLLVELYSAEETSTTFTIRGPAEKIRNSVNVLQEVLDDINGRGLRKALAVNVEPLPEANPHNRPLLVPQQQLLEAGGILLELEVPPVYRNDSAKLFPVYFRRFRNGFSLAMQKAMFEFLRLQTSTGIASFSALGKRELQKHLLEIDRELTDIQSGYQLLLQVAPTNLQQLKHDFFASNAEEIGEYRYRFLPVDPDILKRRLFNLKIEEIDDPAVSYLFSEKREEIDTELTLLKERGKQNFFYSSIRLYKPVDKELADTARELLEQLPEKEEASTDLYTANDFQQLTKNEFDYFRQQNPRFSSKVHVREDVNILMVSRGELYLPLQFTSDARGAEALIQHEIGTHVLTYYNGSQQPLSQLATGLADYDPLQEGIAVLAEYFAGGLSGNRLRTLAGRVVAGACMLQGASFAEIYRELYHKYSFSTDRAFNITSRIYQGGGFLKDIVYLKGLVQLTEYLQNNGSLEKLLAGKFALKHVNVIDDLTERGILSPPVLYPRYLASSDFQTKLKQVRQGLALYKLAQL